MKNTRYTAEIASVEHPNETVTRFIRVTDHFVDLTYVSKRSTLSLTTAHKMLAATERALDEGKHPEESPKWVFEGTVSNPATPIRPELVDETPSVDGVFGEFDLGLYKHRVPGA